MKSTFRVWREKYGFVIVELLMALLCLYMLIITWGDSLFFTGFSVLGVCICGTIGVLDLIRTIKGDS